MSLLNLAEASQVQHIAHFFDLAEAIFQLFVVTDVDAEVDDSRFTFVSLYLGVANIDILVTQARQDVFKDAYPVDDFHLIVDGVSLSTPIESIRRIPADGH